MKSKNIKRNVAVILPFTLLVLLSSCNDWLTLEPEDGVIKDNYWTTKEEVYASVIGCYSGIFSTELRMFLWGELRAEMLIPNILPSSAEGIQAILDGEITSDNAYCNWSTFYTVINQCNTVISFAPDAQKTDDSFTDAMLLQYQGEAKAIRALMYFYLVRTFRDVPFITEAIVSDDQQLRIPKTDGNIILDSLTVDLEEAVRSMASNFGENAADNKGRFSQIGVYSLLADMYLWREKYTQCVSNCDKVINSGKVSLLYTDNSHLYLIQTENAKTGELDTIYNAIESSVDDMFYKQYVLGNSEESIFELQREDDYPNYDYWSMFQTSGYFKANSAAIKELFFIPTEVDRSWYDLRSDGYSIKSDYLWKYIGNARTGNALLNAKTRATMIGNTIVYRLAEIMLMKAEALTQLARVSLEDSLPDLAATQLQEAWDLVKKVRLRSNATEMTDMCLDIVSKNDLSWSTMEKFVYQEEVREMMFEGKLWFNTLRQAKRNDYEYPNITYINYVTIYAYTASKVTSLQTKMNNHDFHYLPIAQSEIESNNALIQNPFYAK
jgi:starch-binding outer membrane protein, SusD/RagB family